MREPAHWVPSFDEDGEKLAQGRHHDPFSYLGLHATGDGWQVRAFVPGATAMELLDCGSAARYPMRRTHPAGIFVAELKARPEHYRLRRTREGCVRDFEDPYRFPSALGSLDEHLIGEGQHWRLYEVLGANRRELNGISGVHFAVWAPNASRVSVVGDFNQWDGRVHPMRLHPATGVWDIFIPELPDRSLYKYEILDSHGQLLPLKSDPFARFQQGAPGNASIVFGSAHEWEDDGWMQERCSLAFTRPVSIYELHLGSWRRGEAGRSLSYRELAEHVVPYVRELGFTHVELLPVSEHPFDASWGYQPIGLFAPTSRFGDPDDFRYFVDACHRAGIGVVVDWVGGHFPRDPHGLYRFDGTALYEHADPRRGLHMDWDTAIFNYGRREVANYLLANALYWAREFHVDAFRVDAVASMLYLDYSRAPGEWLPNERGGNENDEAIAFLRRFNELVQAEGVATIAEESTAWPGVTRPIHEGGLGFNYKWNMGWMHDSLAYMREDPVHRSFHHDRMTFGLIYAFHERFILPLSHDEVVHGKGSLISRMPGDDWQRFANLRAYLSFMYGYPGKKLLFMGGEIGQLREWDHRSELDWYLLAHAQHAGVKLLVSDLNRIYRAVPALHSLDCEPAGFRWIDCDDRSSSVLSWLRLDTAGDFVVVISNFTPVPRHGFELVVPRSGLYREILNTDAEGYGGSNIGNCGTVVAHPIAAGGRLSLSLPPLATLFLRPDAAAIG